MIEHTPGQTRRVDCVAALLSSPDDKIIVIQRDDSPTLRYPNMWSLPGGLVEEPETANDAIDREIQEELSVSIEVKLWKVYERQGRNGLLINQHVYAGTINEKLGDIQLNEGQGFTWISADEIVNFNFAYDFEHLIAEYFRHTTPNKSSQTTR